MTASAFAELAKTIDHTPTIEAKIACTYRLPESIVASVNSIAKVTGVSRTHVVSGMLEIACAQMADAIEENRPDLADELASEEAGEPVFNLCSPENARQIRQKFGNLGQLDVSTEES